MHVHTLASASFLSREDRRAYLKAIEQDEREAAARSAKSALQTQASKWLVENGEAVSQVLRGVR